MSFADFCGIVEICSLPLLGIALLKIRIELRQLRQAYVELRDRNPNIRVIQREIQVGKS